MQVVENGLYIAKDDYFETFRSEYLCDNKQENRPYYCSYIDKDGIIWFIPLSSQVTNYKAKIDKDIAERGQCLFYHIGTVAGNERVFLIGNMFPLTEQYIKKEFTINGKHYIVGDIAFIKTIHKMASRYLTLVKNGKLKPNLDILHIRRELLK